MLTAMVRARAVGLALALALALTCFVAACLFLYQTVSAQQRSTGSRANTQNGAYYRCADSDTCDSPQDDAFKLGRENDLKSNDPDVVRAARAYGKGVTIEFRDLGPVIQSETRHDVRGDGTAPNGLRAVETVILAFNMAPVQLEAAIGHEGSHVADAQDFVKAITPTGEIDQSKNVSIYETEFRAYMVTQAILDSHKVRLGYGECGKETPCHLGFGVARAQAIQTINRLLANPANYCGVGPNYGVTLDNPGPALYEILTPPYLGQTGNDQSSGHR